MLFWLLFSHWRANVYSLNTTVSSLSNTTKTIVKICNLKQNNTIRVIKFDPGRHFVECLPVSNCITLTLSEIANIWSDLTLYHCFGPMPIFCRVQESLGWLPSRPHSLMGNLMKLTLFFWQFAQKTLWQLHSVQVESSEKFENPRWILVSDLYQHLCSLSSSF